MLLPLGCGYSFQGTENPFAKLGIETIYVQAFENASYRLGVEHFFTRAMVREIERAKVFRITNDRERADAILRGSLSGISREPSGKTVLIGDKSAQVATTFRATASVHIELVDRFDNLIYRGSVSGNRSHPGSLVLGSNDVVLQNDNVTAPLINESEQRLALRFLADQMMGDAYQQMLAVF